MKMKASRNDRAAERTRGKIRTNVTRVGTTRTHSEKAEGGDERERSHCDLREEHEQVAEAFEGRHAAWILRHELLRAKRAAEEREAAHCCRGIRINAM